MMSSVLRWAAAMVVVASVWGMLSFYQATSAAPKEARQPFNNSVQQRQEMIRELQAIKALLQEQNTLLRAAAAEANRQGGRR